MPPNSRSRSPTIDRKLAQVIHMTHVAKVTYCSFLDNHGHKHTPKHIPMLRHARGAILKPKTPIPPESEIWQTFLPGQTVASRVHAGLRGIRHRNALVEAVGIRTKLTGDVRLEVGLTRFCCGAVPGSGLAFVERLFCASLIHAPSVLCHACNHE